MIQNPVIRVASLSLLLSTAITNACVISTDDPDDDTTGTGTGTQSTTGSNSSSTDSTNSTDTTDTSGSTSTSSTTTSGSGSDTDSSGSDTTTTPEITECDRDLVPTMTITEDTINVDTTWSGVVAIDTSLYIDAVVTIAPGTTVLVQQDARFVFGYLGPATVLAQGTAESPIFFCGKKIGAVGAHWQGLSFSDKVTSNSVLEHVYIDDAGTTNYPAIDSEVGVLLKNVAVSDALGVGVRARDFKSGSSGLTVTRAGTHPVEITGAEALTNFPVGGALTGNGKDRILVTAGEVRGNTTVHAADVPYEQAEKLYQYQDTLTFEAGVEYLFGPDTGIVAGYTGGATLMVNGTADKPVHFGGVSPDKGWWHGIDISANVTSNSTLSYLNLSDAGGGAYFGLGIEAPIKLDHVNVTNGNNGVRIAEQGLAGSSAALSISGMSGFPAEVDPSALFTFPADGSFTGNGTDAILVKGAYIGGTGTIKKLNVPYQISETVYQEANSKVTIAAGTSFKMASDSGFVVSYGGGGEFVAVGTAVEPISFTGVDASAGSWKAITIDDSALSSSKFDYVTISHGGAGATGMLLLNKPLSVTNSTFTNSAGYGITKRSDDATDYTVSNTFTDNAMGDIGTF